MTELEKLNKFVDDNFGNYYSGLGFELKQQVFKAIEECNYHIEGNKELINANIMLKSMIDMCNDNTVTTYMTYMSDNKLSCWINRAVELIERIDLRNHLSSTKK